MLPCHIRKPCRVASIVGDFSATSREKKIDFSPGNNRIETKKITDITSALFPSKVFFSVGAAEGYPRTLTTLQGFLMWHRSILRLGAIPSHHK